MFSCIAFLVLCIYLTVNFAICFSSPLQFLVNHNSSLVDRCMVMFCEILNVWGRGSIEILYILEIA